MPPAATSNLASAHSQVRAASYRRYGRGDTTNKSRCNLQSAPAIEAQRQPADEKHAPVTRNRPAALMYPRSVNSEASREFASMLDDLTPKMRSVQPRKRSSLPDQEMRDNL